MNDAVLLVAALADSEFTAPGSSFDKTCKYCGRLVMLAPTSQRMLRKHPDAIITCVPCFSDAYDSKPEVFDRAEKILAGTPDEVAREINSAVPNLRRNRN